MKKKISLLIIGTFAISFIYCQQEVWQTYSLDSTITIDLPGEAFQLDTTMNGIKMSLVYSNINNSHFAAQKTWMLKDYMDKNLSQLPYDSASLEKYYSSVIEGAVSSAMKRLKSKKPVMSGNIKGYHLQFADSANNSVQEMEFYILNEYLYNLSYINYADFNSNERDIFFNSIKILNSKGVSQFPGKDPAYKVGYAMGKYVFYIAILLIIAVVVYFTSKKRKKADNPIH